MAKKFNAPDGPFFVGDEREMRVLATWIDDFERAAVCRISSAYREPDYATVQREATLAEDWKRARDAGRYKLDFAKDKKLTVKHLDAPLDRVANRKRTSE